MMKDQITTLLEALRLVGIEVERFKRKRQTSDATLDAIVAILDDSKVTRAMKGIQPLVSARTRS
jgi:hypothetical protein